MNKEANNNRLIESELLNYGVYASTTRGVSMEPLFRTGRDVVFLSRPEGELKKYDIALYRMPSGKYVMHRVVKVKENEYIIRGDNTFVPEHVPKDKILAVLTEFNRKGKKYSCSSRSYRIYSVLWTFIYPVRYVLHLVRRALGKIYRTLIRRK